MKRHFQKTWITVLTVVVAALTGTWAVGAVQDRYEVTKMTEKMQTVCVGRMLIDLPAEVQYRLYGQTISSFNIDASEESQDAFSVRVAKREADLRAKPDRLGGGNNLEIVREVKTDSGLIGKIFMHGRVVTEGSAYTATGESHYRYENVALEAHVHGKGISIELSAEKYDPDLAGNLTRLLSQLVANPANRIPTESGFCLDRAYVRDPLTANQREQIVMVAGLPSRPDIEIRFDTFAGTKPSGSRLLERVAASHARAPVMVSARFTNLRAAPRTIGGLSGDELVERVVEENFSIVYGFRWEVNGTEDDVFVPDVHLMMKTGSGDDGPVPSSLSQPAALALWDKISSSIRRRPTQEPRHSAAESTSPPLGIHVAAGEACPQTGWWQCGHVGTGARGHRGERQYIRQGEPMPQALLLPPQTLWEKLRGVQPSYEEPGATSWRLVDKRRHKRVQPDVPLARAAIGAVNGDGGDKVSLGAYAITGKPCPASGSWKCPDSGALDGTRWIGCGQILPAATFTVPARIFGKAGDAPKTMQRRATWQLVRLDQAPGAAENEHHGSRSESHQSGPG